MASTIRKRHKGLVPYTEALKKKTSRTPTDPPTPEKINIDDVKMLHNKCILCEKKNG